MSDLNMDCYDMKMCDDMDNSDSNSSDCDAVLDAADNDDCGDVNDYCSSSVYYYYSQNSIEDLLIDEDWNYDVDFLFANEMNLLTNQIDRMVVEVAGVVVSLIV